MHELGGSGSSRYKRVAANSPHRSRCEELVDRVVPAKLVDIKCAWEPRRRGSHRRVVGVLYVAVFCYHGSRFQPELLAERSVERPPEDEKLFLPVLAVTRADRGTTATSRTEGTVRIVVVHPPNRRKERAVSQNRPARSVTASAAHGGLKLQRRSEAGTRSSSLSRSRSTSLAEAAVEHVGRMR
jgi:hypothetical protein